MRFIFYSFGALLLIFLAPVISKSQPVANFGASVTSGCSPIVVQFNDLSTGNPTSWFWNLGNGTTSALQNPSTTYLNAGTYPVSLTVSNSSGTDVKTLSGFITVIPSPVVNFVASDSLAGCAPRLAQFTSSVTPGIAGNVNYAWDFGDGNTSTVANPSHVYQNTGNYSVTLIATNSGGCTKSLIKTGYIQAVTKPSASFTTTNNMGCSVPLNVSFSNTSAGAISYVWNFGDGGSSTAASPSHSYTSLGSYGVQLIAKAAGTCADTLTIPNDVIIANPAAAFTSSANSICPNTSVHFDNNSTPAGVTSFWKFGDGTTSTQANPTHTYTTAGNYIAKLVINQGTCTDSTTTPIVVNANPHAQFSASTTVGCSLPFNASFTNSSTGASNYIWNFGDGGTSTLANPLHSYTTAGNFTVRLIALNSSGCADTLIQNNFIQVAPISAGINFGQNSTCIPSTTGFLAYTNSSVPISNYTWSFGDGSTGSGVSPSHIYTSAGTYNVTMSGTDVNGCSFSSTIPVSTYTKPTATFVTSATSACFGTGIQFTSTSNNTGNTIWDFHDGSFVNASVTNHSFWNMGVFSVTLYAFNGTCADTLTVPNMITINGPVPLFSASVSCVDRKTVSFTNTSNGSPTSFSWNFGDGTTSTLANPVHTYTSFGPYFVTLNVSNGICSSSKTDSISLYPLQKAFTANDTTICKGQSVTFTHTVDNNPVAYKWFFGDGSSVQNNAATVTHTYLLPGNYTVKLVAQDANGCKDSLVKTSYIKVNGPIASITNTSATGCSPLTVTFGDQSTTTAGSNIVSRNWSFGDGTTVAATSAGASHTYNASVATNYNAKLVITDNAGCMDSVLSPVISITRPHAAFTANNTVVCKGASVNFTNQTTAGNANYLWSFGDGTTATTANPTHAYATAGTYTVRLIAWNQNACSDTLVKTNYITVNSISTSFTISDSFASCPPLLVSATNTSTGANNYSWSFGNGNTSVLGNPSTLYTIPGSYTMKLVATSTSGCIDSATKIVTINGPYGTLAYTPVSGCSPVTVQFTSVANNAQTYTWDMNNGNTTTTNTGSTVFTYTHPGVYVPVLVLSNTANCNVAIQGVDTIRVDSLSTGFEFNVTGICQNAPIQFHDTLYNTYSTTVNRTWLFGDGGTSTQHNPTHVYAASGTYIAKLIVTNSFGCQDTVTHTIVVHPLPLLTITGGNPVTICGIGNSAPITASGAASYSWTPGTGLSCLNCANPVATPLVNTTYTLTGTDSNGCVNTATVPVVVGPYPVLTTTNDTSICTGSSLALHVSGAASYSWSPSSGVSCLTCTNPTVAPLNGSNIYTVIGTSAIGCKDTAFVNVSVNGLPDMKVSVDTAICYGLSAHLLATGAASFSWSPAASLSCSGCASPFAIPSSTTTYSVKGTNATGCSITKQVTVKVNNLPNVNAGANQTICRGATATLSGSGAIGYSWTPSTALSCTNCQNPISTAATNIQYVVTGTDANGCQDSASVQVTVIQKVPTSVGPALDICLGESATLTAKGGTSYTWYPAATIDDSHSAEPTARPEETTRYKVAIVQNQCFTDTLYQKVNVHPIPTVQLGQDKSIFEGETVQLTLNSSNATSYEWFPKEGLSCSNCYNPAATPEKTTTYTVTASNDFGCKSSDDIKISLRCDNSMVFVPNTFTPNGDGHNDFFFPNAKGISIADHFQVYDRWGELVFSLDNMRMNEQSAGWDGMFKGKMLKPDTYVYILQATCSNGDPIQVKGDISLIR